VWTRDGIAGINDVAASEPDEWLASSLAPTYIGATSFSVAGDQTGTFQVGRRIRATLAGSTRYGRITSSSFGAGITTIGVSLDTGSLDATLSAIAYGLISVTNSSLIQRRGMVVQSATGTPYTTYTDISIVIPTDTSKPQNTEGIALTSVTITPTNPDNILRIEAAAWGTIASAGTATIALFQDAVADAIAVGPDGGSAGAMCNPVLVHEMVAGGVAAITFALRGGPSTAAANWYINGNASNQLFGSLGACRLRVTEIAG
jgi:hypothetical protein